MVNMIYLIIFPLIFQFGGYGNFGNYSTVSTTAVTVETVNPSGLYLYINPKTQRDQAKLDSVYNQTGLTVSGAIKNTTADSFWTNASNQYAMRFYGVNEYVDFGIILATGTSEIIVQVWTKVDAVNKHEIVISRGWGNNASRWSLYSFDGAGSDQFETMYANSQAIRDLVNPHPIGAWMLWTMVLRAGGAVEVYADDLLIASGSLTTYNFIGTDASNQRFALGAIISAGTWMLFLTGEIGITSVYWFDGSDDRPAAVPATYYADYVIRNYNNQKSFYGK